MVRAVIVGLALCLTGCDREQEAKQNNRICLTPGQMVPGDWENCVHRWGYRLAGAKDGAQVIAQAVVNACTDAMAYQVNHSPEAQRKQLAQEIMTAMPDRALFHVIQARAGRCNIPE